MEEWAWERGEVYVGELGGVEGESETKRGQALVGHSWEVAGTLYLVGRRASGPWSSPLARSLCR